VNSVRYGVAGKTSFSLEPTLIRSVSFIRRKLLTSAEAIRVDAGINAREQLGIYEAIARWVSTLLDTHSTRASHYYSPTSDALLLRLKNQGFRLGSTPNCSEILIEEACDSPNTYRPATSWEQMHRSLKKAFSWQHLSSRVY
jgi:hypothetical protein